MAWRVRTAVFKLPSSGIGVLHKVTPNTKNVAFVQAACISTKYIRSIRPPPAYDRPKPFDYMNKRYGQFAQMFDQVMERFDDNSKIVVVDGTIASGKTEVAKALADEFGMLYLPAVFPEDIRKSVYKLMQENKNPTLQFLSVETFLKNPHHVNAGIFQTHIYYIRFREYMNALNHLLSTGQGVVLERCPWSDVVFMNAMQQVGYVTPAVWTYYKEVVRNTIHYLMRPNLIVYLDAPVETVLEKIKQRGIPYEVNAKAFTKDYLQAIEDTTRTDYLKRLSSHAEILIYDWSNGGDIGSVIEDIERINFETHKDDPKHSDWKFNTVDDVRLRRSQYSNDFDYILTAFNVTQLWNDEVHLTPTEYASVRHILDIDSDDEEEHDPPKVNKVLGKP